MTAQMTSMMKTMVNDDDNHVHHHLCRSQGRLNHAGGVADKGEHCPVCRLSGNCSHGDDEGAMWQMHYQSLRLLLIIYTPGQVLYKHI